MTTAATRQPDARCSLAEPAAQSLPVSAAGLSKWIDDRPILHEINLHVQPGSYLVLLGANGAGKSTLLNVIATLIGYTHGQLHLFGRRVGRNTAALRSRIGMIGHQPMLYRDLSVRENLIFFGRLYGIKHPRRRAGQLLEQVNLADRGDDPVATFSRGMVQRAAIARALVHDPQLLLADEPFSGLDVPSTLKLEQLLTQLNRQGKTIIMANHDVGQSVRLGGRVLVMRRGRIVADQSAGQIDADRLVREVTAP